MLTKVLKEVAKLNQQRLRKQLDSLMGKSYHTKEEAKVLKNIQDEYLDVSFDLGIKPTSIKTVLSDNSLNTLKPETVVSAFNARLTSKPILKALRKDVMGVDLGKTTNIDKILLNQDALVTPKILYSAFEPTRNLLRKQHGKTIKLYRAQPSRSIDKPTQNWSTTEEFARKFTKTEGYEGAKIISKEVPIEQVVAVNVNRNGAYHEIIVAKDLTRATANKLLNKPPLKKKLGGYVEAPVKGRRRDI